MLTSLSLLSQMALNMAAFRVDDGALLVKSPSEGHILPSYSIDRDTYPTRSGILWTDSHAMARIAEPNNQLQINKTDGIGSIVAEFS